MFHHHAALNLPRLEQRNLDSGRVYAVLGTDLVYPSITRVLGAKPKPHLAAWRERVGHDEANRISKAASGRGTKLHSLAEQYLGNKSVDTVEPHVMELWRYLRPWLDAHITGVYAQEVDLYSDKLMVAGRTDLVADVDGVLSIVDFKQANKPKKESYIHDYYLQGTFYALALYERTGMKCKQVLFPITSPEGTQIFVTKPANHYDELFTRIEEFYSLYAEAAV
jgi:hypothetical protein